MKIFNTMSRSKEEFVPLEPGKVKMYVCGPTVYNYIHIGNARPLIVFDTVRRYMEYKGLEVKYVSNFTDVDDKIIKKAAEEGVSCEEISERYIEACREDMKELNVREATIHPQATQEMDGIIDLIKTLIDKGYAYSVADGHVYYQTEKFKDYGKLSHKNIEDLQAGHRDIKVSGEMKRNFTDFVLWKPKKEGEPSWPSPWGDGRPGWHIECSCMGRKYLGDTMDIHAGGEDLIFPHHENEIAQSEGATGVTFANYWMHNGFLNIDNKKMSKSAGNFFTVKEIAQKYDLQVVRFFMLSAHYRGPLNFSEELMEAAKNGLDRIKTAVDNLGFLEQHSLLDQLTQEEKLQLEEAKSYIRQFEQAMDDDFNTADAISSIFELVRYSNTVATAESSKAFEQGLLDEIIMLADILGITLGVTKEMLAEDIEALIEERQQARKNRDFARADEIRDKLLEKDIILEDTREGVKWRKA